jgi:hypothetical protein
MAKHRIQQVTINFEISLASLGIGIILVGVRPVSRAIEIAGGLRDGLKDGIRGHLRDGSKGAISAQNAILAESGLARRLMPVRRLTCCKTSKPSMSPI